MTDRCFIDTNVFVYAVDHAEPAKMVKAQALIGELERSGRACLSTQVLQEFFVAATRKLGVPVAAARAQVMQLAMLDTVVVTPELVCAAIDLCTIHQLSLWDALIVKSAGAAGCRTLYSEDMHHGQVIDGVRVVSPFAPAP